MVETRSARKAKREPNGASSPRARSPAATKARKAPAKAAPKHVEFEFGGPIGAGANVVLLPCVVVGLAVACDGAFCLGPSPLAAFAPPALGELLQPKAFAVVLGWLAFQALLQVALPGDVVEGTKLADGTRLPYLMNGHLAFWVSLAVLACGVPRFDATGAFVGLGAADLAFLYDDFVPLAVAASVVSALLALGLYAASFRPSKPLLAEPGDTGYAVYDFWMGRELNPRIGSFDLKCFCELRPGLIGWAVLNAGMLCKQRELEGKVSGAMVLVNAFQLLYVWDALFYEKVILTTMDITTDGFGYMLAFGDLAWVPFTYCLQARHGAGHGRELPKGASLGRFPLVSADFWTSDRVSERSRRADACSFESARAERSRCIKSCPAQARYLVRHDPGLGPLALAAIVALKVVGYAVFRGANNQKDAFRRDPAKAIAEGTTFLDTRRGTKLITSGYWGAARKVNYTGDWLMSLAWCLLAGFGSPVPYFYCAYFLVLLVHRALRDDHACALKYGADWPEYKKKVPYLFVPFVF